MSVIVEVNIAERFNERGVRMSRLKIVTDEVQHRYCALIAVGCTRRQAAALMGFSESTIRTAMKADDRFAADVQTNERNRETLSLAKLQTAGQRSWRAAVRFLEHLNPQEFRRRNDPPNRRNAPLPLDIDDVRESPPNDPDWSPRVSSPMESDLPDREGP
jgi:hypothetical protein